MPAKKILILENQQDNTHAFKVAFRVDVPEPLQPFYAAEQAAYASPDPSISQVELAEIQSGAVKEFVDNVAFESTATQEVIDANLVAGWTQKQAEVNADQRYLSAGRYWNGTAWVEA